MLKRLLGRLLKRPAEPVNCEQFYVAPTMDDYYRIACEQHEHHMEDILRNGVVRVHGWQNCILGTQAYAANELAFMGLMEARLLPYSQHHGGVFEYTLTSKGRDRLAADA